MARQRIAIIGAGPIGIESALQARSLGHDVVVFESGQIADSIRSWGFIQLFSPWSMNTTPLGWQTLGDAGMNDPPDPQACPFGKEFVDRYLLPLATSPPLRSRILTQTKVLGIGRNDSGKSDEPGSHPNQTPFHILVQDAGGFEHVEKADIILDCSGTYKHHRWAGRGGVPAPGERALEHQIWYTLPDVLGHDRARFADRHILLLGAGFSAATVLVTMEQLSHSHPNTRVSWAIRRIGQAMQALHNDPLEARTNLARASLRLADHPPAWLQYLGNCVLERIESHHPFDIVLKYGDTDLALTVDEVVALVGYAPEMSFYEQLQIPPQLPAGAAPGDGIEMPASNLFILGAKSFGTNSNFLLQIGHKQIRHAFQVIDPDSS